MASTTKTPFEQAVQDAAAGKLKVPHVSFEGKSIPFFIYQLCVVKMQLSLNAKGMKPTRNWRLADIRAYYGLKSRTGKGAFEEFMTNIFNVYYVKTTTS